MNDTDRADWIDNDISLYSWWRSSRMAITPFVRDNRAKIDEHINKVLNTKVE